MRILFLLNFLIHFSLWSQSNQQEYLKARNFFASEQFSESTEAFAALVSDPVFGSHSTFYLGLSHYRNEQVQKGLDAWKQLIIKYPKFSQLEEVHFWITQVYFEQGNYPQAVGQAKWLKVVESRKSLYEFWLGKQSFQLIQQLQLEFEDDRDLAHLVVKRSLFTDLTDDDRAYVLKLKSKFGIISRKSNYDDVKKNGYTAAIFLPFLFDDLENTNQVMHNSLVMDMYQGMMLASDLLDESNIVLNLIPYDTRRNTVQTQSILNTTGLSEVDLIIGPLLPEPIELVNSFSREYEINVINPISSNSRTIADNPFAFQMKPSYKTMARKTAEFVASTATKKESMIYYEDKPAEKILAAEFQKAIKEYGFDVTNFQMINSKSAQAVLARFADHEEKILKITDDEALALLEEGRLIRSQEQFDARGNLIVNEDGTPHLRYYELNFTFDTDSLDHIFAVTRSNLLANNFVGAVESIPDTVRLIGLGKWIDFSMLDYHQLERLGVNLINAEYFDRASDFYKEVQSRYIQKHGSELTIYSMLGFESVWWAGQMMSRYGKYFQNGFYKEQNFPTLLYGHEYKEGLNDNQIVPIVQFTNGILQPINLQDDPIEE